MKINKRKCRAFADSGFKMQSHSGILHAEQIGYIIRTDVKIIDHHQTLILYIYPRGQAAQGDCHPLWTVFQTREDYATLERQEDGSLKWRTAAFKCLGGGWGFHQQCAFYSLHDEARLFRYLKANANGIRALVHVQEAILEDRRSKRQLIREGKVIDRMESVPVLPRGLKNWIHKSVMPAYFFYDYKKGGKNVLGICSACGREMILSGVKQGQRAVCPHCRHELVMKPRSRRGYCMMDRSTCQVIQNVGNGELVIRIIKARYTYKGDTPEIEVYENARQFIRLDVDGSIPFEVYYHSYKSGLRTDWKKGQRPVFSQWQYNFEADTCAHLYTRNLPEVLKGTPWQYCPISTFYTHFHKPMQAYTFLYAYLKHPRLERSKSGSVRSWPIWSIDTAIAKRSAWTNPRTGHTRSCRWLQNDVDFLRGLDVDLPTLKLYRMYQGVKDRQKLLLWHLEHEVKRDVATLLNYMTAYKFMKVYGQSVWKPVPGCFLAL